MAFLVLAVVFGWVLYRYPLQVADTAMSARLRIAGIRGAYARAGLYRVHYLTGGRGRPLVLLHGVGGRSQDWVTQLPAYVKRGFRVYAVDLLGFGRTDRPDIEYSIQQQVEMVLGFLDTLGLKRADVVGWSMGGWVALRLALRCPERVGRLVAMNSAGLRFSTHLTPEIFEPQSIGDVKRLVAALIPDPPRLPDFVYRAILHAMESNREVMHRSLESMVTGNDLLDGKLGNLQVPALVIWGARDYLIPLEVGRQMHREIRRCELEIYPDAGHLAPLTCARQIVDRVVEFLG